MHLELQSVSGEQAKVRLTIGMELRHTIFNTNSAIAKYCEICNKHGKLGWCEWGSVSVCDGSDGVEVMGDAGRC